MGMMCQMMYDVGNVM